MIRINIKNLKVGDNVILESAKAHVKKGQFIAITGESGSGKSSLLNAVCNLEKNYDGVIELLEVDNKTINDSEMRHLFRDFLSLVTQDNGLVLNETGLKNIMYIPRVRKNKNSEQINQALRMVNLNQDMLNRKVSTLSGGEQQRLAIAKAILKRTQIIVSDEPTGNLDEENAHHIYSIFRRLADAGITICIVTHDLNIGNYADKVYVIKNKKLYLRK